MKNKKPSVYIDENNNVIINVEQPKCRECGEKLYGGECDFGVCDSCDDNVDVID